LPPTATTVTMNDTAPTIYRWDLTAVEITAPPTAPAVAAFTYNQANELTASTTPAGVTAGYTYDGDGLRATRTTPAATQTFAWALSGGLPVLLTDTTISYLYDDNGTPIEQIDAAGVALYYQHDQYGSTRLLTDAAGAVAATFSYDPYGNLTGHTGTADTPLRWNGQYQDTDTGLYYLRARYYDPTTAQFLTRDLLVALTMSPYGYAAGDPLNSTDPTGLICWSASCIADDAAIAAAVVGIAAAVTLLCVATACIGDIAIAAGATTLAGTYAVAEPVGTVASVAGLGAAAVGGASDTFKAWNACSPYSSRCPWAVGGVLLDAATFGAGRLIPEIGPWQALLGIGSGGATLTYGKLTSDGGRCTKP
jgi:RHS repeat-associated protein